MVEIPQIKPRYGVEEVNEEQGAIQIPKISPEASSKKLPKKGKKMIRFLKKFALSKILKKKWVRISGIILAIGTFFLIILGILSFGVYLQGVNLKKSLDSLVTASESQDLQVIGAELQNTKKVVDKFGRSYSKIAWLKFLPLVGGYLRDGQHAINASKYALDAAEIFVEVITPYADIIGFAANSEQATSALETAQDRLEFIIKAIPQIIPRADEIIEKVGLVRLEVDQINSDRYPEKFLGKVVRERIRSTISAIDLLADLLPHSKPLLEKTHYLMGVDEERTYLVIFQNDKELRPTGGFITAYSIAKVNKGKFEPVISSDIYNLDEHYTPTIPASDPVIKYLKGPYEISRNYRLRDMNWSPDFSESMKIFSEEIEKAGITDIDGIIAVDTHLLVNILEVLGEIQVPGYGGYSNDIVEVCNCPQVVYELESFADIEGPIVWSENEPGKIVFAPPNYDNRKKIIGPMMNSILANAMGLTKDKIPALFEALLKSVVEKHVLLYMFDSEVQNAVENFGLAGTLKQYEGDYLHINDANMGGRKSNLYLTTEVNQEVDVASDGTATKTLTITYKNPMRYDGWLNSVLPNYVRIYVPKRSELVDISGLQDKEEPYEEFDKTVFAGLFELRPEGIAKVVVTYKLPFKVDEEYKLFIQKQPGTDKPLYTMNLGKKSDEFFLSTDKELKFSL